MFEGAISKMTLDKCKHTVLGQLIIFAAGILALAAANAHAGTPAALALDVFGPTTPAVEPFSELETKSPIELDADTTMEFLHYASCKAVTVKGGRLNFTKQRYLYKGGKIIEAKRAECPKSVALTGASQIGGVILRGAGKKKSVTATTRPSFVLIGQQADSYANISIAQNGRPVFDAKLHGRVFFYPETAPALTKGQSYDVTLTPSGGGKARNFKIKARNKPKKYTLTLIRVD